MNCLFSNSSLSIVSDNYLAPRYLKKHEPKQYTVHMQVLSNDNFNFEDYTFCVTAESISEATVLARRRLTTVLEFAADLCTTDTAKRYSLQSELIYLS